VARFVRLGFRLRFVRRLVFPTRILHLSIGVAAPSGRVVEDGPNSLRTVGFDPSAGSARLMTAEKAFPDFEQKHPARLSRNQNEQDRFLTTRAQRHREGREKQKDF